MYNWFNFVDCPPLKNADESCWLNPLENCSLILTRINIREALGFPSLHCWWSRNLELGLSRPMRGRLARPLDQSRVSTRKKAYCSLLYSKEQKTHDWPLIRKRIGFRECLAKPRWRPYVLNGYISMQSWKKTQQKCYLLTCDSPKPHLRIIHYWLFHTYIRAAVTFQVRIFEL